METFKSLNTILKRGHGDKKNNLPHVKKTAAVLGLQKLPFKTIHIAGTNGKGTTAMLLAGALKNAGFKTGLFISPHVYNICERVQVNSRQITLKDLDFYAAQVLRAETGKLNFFEVLTLAALLYFRTQHVDYAVIECGLGGLKDSTNIINPALSIITSIGLDHCGILGNTTAQIAAQKAGIIKKNTPCIIGRLAQAAKVVIAKTARAKKAKLIQISAPGQIIINPPKRGLKFSYKNKKYFLSSLCVVQAQNAAIVLEACRILNIKLSHAAASFKTFKMPGRFEVLPVGKKYLIKDGAHNPEAVREFLKAYLKTPYAKGQNTLIYAASADKDYKTCAKILQKHFAVVILPGCAGLESPQIIKKHLKKATIAKIETLTAGPIKKLPGNIIALGSFYLLKNIPFRPC